MPRRVRKGDQVAVIAGDDKGKRGRVLRVLVDKNRVVVEGVNLVYKHLRRSQQNPQGGRIRKEAAIHISNVMPVDPSDGEPTRVAYRLSEGRHVRVARKSGTALEAAASKGAAKARASADAEKK
jgi:large subunit ribosomal protein L24